MRIIWIALLTCVAMNVSGQALGFKVGYASINFTADTLNIKNVAGQDTFQIWIDNRGAASYTGFFFRIPFEPFFIEIEPLISRYRLPLKVSNVQDWNGGSVTKYERFNSLELSLLFGVRAWETLRFEGGITGQYYFNLDSEMEVFSEDYQNEWEQFVQSWKVGVGLDYEKFNIGINYERPFSSIGNNIVFFGQNYDLNAKRERFSVKVGIVLANTLK
jgi:hypothetical protein